MITGAITITRIIMRVVVRTPTTIRERLRSARF